MKILNGLLILVCVLFPANAWAVQEGVVEEAPLIDLAVSELERTEYYLPDASYYAQDEEEILNDPLNWGESGLITQNEEGIFGPVTQVPHLLMDEVQRAQALLADFKAGKISYTGDSVLEKEENVIVGVYGLNPEDFDGETVYVILPGTCLTDEEILSIMDAYDKMGMTFDPTKLNYRNCARGGGIEISRFLTGEERKRYDYMIQRIRRGQLTVPEGVATLHHPIRTLKLDDRYFNGLTDFTIIPFHSMTDEELIVMMQSLSICDQTDTLDFDALEAMARADLYKALRMPLYMECIDLSDGMEYIPVLFTDKGERGYDWSDNRKGIDVMFTCQLSDGYEAYASAIYDAETKQLSQLSWTHKYEYDDQQVDVNDSPQKMLDAAVVHVEDELGLSEMTWNTVHQERTFVNGKACIPVRALLDDHAQMTIYVSADDGHVHGIEIVYGTLVDALE